MSFDFQFLMTCPAQILDVVYEYSLDEAIRRGAHIDELRALRAAHKVRKHEHLELIIDSLPR